jgi:RND superfamily putative drug exporter
MQRRREIVKVDSPYAPGNSGQIAPSGHAALVTMELRGDADDSKDVKRVLAVTAAAQHAHPGLRIEQFGDASANEAIGKMFSDDFHKAEVLSIPVTLAILVLAFGALAAAGIPLLLALSSVMATLGLVAVGSHVLPTEDSVSSVVLLIGLAVGVDYALFYLRREREERAAGRSAEAALQAAAATSGRAVLISGLTVMIAMSGMFLAGATTFTAMAMGAILVVGVSLIASLTILPALLSKLGDRVERGRIPFLMRRRGSGTGRAWGALLDAVRRRPRSSLIVAGGLLVALCLPVLGMHRVAGDRLAAAQPAGDADLRPHPGRLPRQGDRCDRRRQEQCRVDPAGPGGDRAPAQTRARERRRQRPDHGRRRQRRQGRAHRPADRRRRRGQGLVRLARRDPRQADAGAAHRPAA